MTVQNPTTVRLKRKTKETDIGLALRVRAEGTALISTGLGMLDHLLDALSRHSRIDLHLEASGDLETD
ncbi:MAG: imidazoleglycerol-phosphate dehydratase, partial [Planctomycetota bacterium]